MKFYISRHRIGGTPQNATPLSQQLTPAAAVPYRHCLMSRGPMALLRKRVASRGISRTAVLKASNYPFHPLPCATRLGPDPERRARCGCHQLVHPHPLEDDDLLCAHLQYGRGSCICSPSDVAATKRTSVASTPSLSLRSTLQPRKESERGSARQACDPD